MASHKGRLAHLLIICTNPSGSVSYIEEHVKSPSRQALLEVLEDVGER